MPTTVATGTMKVAQITKPGGGFQVVERAIPEPGPGQVRIKVQACGVCHSDVLTAEGLWPGIEYPRIPGHEVAGVIDAVGAGVTEWKKGSAPGSAGMAATTARVANAVAEISATAAMRRLRASAMTVDISNTWWLRRRRWWRFRKV